MTVTIIGSISSSETEIRHAVHSFQDILGCTVYDPVKNNAQEPEEPLLNVMFRYLSYIDAADLIVVVPKSPGVYGESTTYELAYAMRLGKPIVEFVQGGY